MNKKQFILNQLSAQIEAENRILQLLKIIIEDCLIICNEENEKILLFSKVNSLKIEAAAAKERQIEAIKMASIYEAQIKEYKKEFDLRLQILSELNARLTEYEATAKSKKEKILSKIHFYRTPDNFAPDITPTEIAAIYAGLPPDFKPTAAQFSALFGRPVIMPAPIKTTPGRAAALLAALYSAGFIRTAQFAARAGFIQCFEYNGRPITAEQLHRAKETNKRTYTTIDFDYIKELAK